MTEFAELVRDAKALMDNLISLAQDIKPSDGQYDKAEALWNGINKGLEDANEQFKNTSFDRAVMNAPVKPPPQVRIGPRERKRVF